MYRNEKGHSVHRRIVPMALFVALCLFSLFVLKPMLSSVDNYSHQISQLDNKRQNVMMLVAASSVTSALISTLPEDTATSIANQLADFSKIFILILAVLLAEKYMLTIFGAIGSYLLATGFFLFAFYYGVYRRKWFRDAVIKILAMAIALITFIPASVFITDLIETTFESSINSVINEALASEEELREEEAAYKEAELQEEETDNGGFLGTITGAINSVGDTISGAVSSVGDTLSGAVSFLGNVLDTAKNALSNFVEAIAVMLVTSCVIPIITLLMYIAVIKYVFGLRISVSNLEEGFTNFLNRQNSNKLQKIGTREE